MKKLLIALVLTGLVGLFHAEGQQVNGQSLTFSKGKTEWSDTLYRNLHTKKMARDGVKPVLIAIRCKFLRKTDDGSLYQIEITNKSRDTRVKFNVHASHGQDVYAVKLNPGQTRTFQKFYWRAGAMNPSGIPNPEDEYYDPLLEELIQNRE